MERPPQHPTRSLATGAGPGDLGEQPGAATMSPPRKTPSPRSIAGRSRQVVPGRSSAPLRPSITCRRRQVSRSRQSAQGERRAAARGARRPASAVLAGPDRHLRLDQLLAVRRQRGIGRAEALDPARLSRSETTQGSPRRCSSAEVEADGVAAGPAAAGRRRAAAGVRTARGRRSPAASGERVDALAGHDRHAERARAALERLDQHAPAADARSAPVGGGAEQEPARCAPRRTPPRARPGRGGRCRRRPAEESISAVRSSVWSVDPAAEVLVDGRLRPRSRSTAGIEAERRRAVQLALLAEAHTGQRQAAVGGIRSRSREPVARTAPPL